MIAVRQDNLALMLTLSFNKGVFITKIAFFAILSFFHQLLMLVALALFAFVAAILTVLERIVSEPEQAYINGTHSEHVVQIID